MMNICSSTLIIHQITIISGLMIKNKLIPMHVENYVITYINCCSTYIEYTEEENQDKNYYY